MPSIFISYRRDDSAYPAQMIRSRLVQDYGASSVFMDIDNVPLGVDFRIHINQAVAKCDLFIAVIGEYWEGKSVGSPTRRIDSPTDFVRLELEAALSRGIPVVPVLVGKAQPPKAEDLPPSLSDIAFRNAAEVRPGKEVEAQLASLSRGLARHFVTKPSGSKIVQSAAPKAYKPLPRNEPAKPPSLRFQWRWIIALVAAAVFIVTAVANFMDRPPHSPATESTPSTTEPPASLQPASGSDPALPLASTLQPAAPNPVRRPTKILDPGKIVSTPGLTLTELRSAGVDADLASTIVRRSNEVEWPRALSTTTLRWADDNRNLNRMKDYKTYLIAEIPQKERTLAVLQVPANENQFMPPELRPDADFFVAIDKVGIRN